MLTKIVRNPYLLAITMLICEAVTNITTSLLSGKELGETNLSFFVWLLAAAYIAAFVLKEPVSGVYTTKLVCTYFGIIFLIGILTSLGTPATLSSLYVGALFTAILAAVSYWGFNFMQRRFAAAIQKQTETKKQLEL
jgi:hypothetical protein